MNGFRRIEKLSMELKRELSQIICYEMNDPRLGFVSVLRVDISRDKRQAKIYVSVLGESRDKKATLGGLKHARGFIQKCLGDRLKTRYVPEIHFFLDESIEHGIRLSHLIDHVAEEFTHEEE